MIGGRVALVPDEDDLLELVGSGAEGGHPDRKLGQKLGLVGRVHLQNICTVCQTGEQQLSLSSSQIRFNHFQCLR